MAVVIGSVREARYCAARLECLNQRLLRLYTIIEHEEWLHALAFGRDRHVIGSSWLVKASEENLAR